MIISKKLSKFKEIKHGFFNNKGGCSTGIYKSLNCGPGSNDNKTKVLKNLIDKAWISATIIFIISQFIDVQYYDARISLTFWILLAGLKCIADERKLV